MILLRNRLGNLVYEIHACIPLLCALCASLWQRLRTVSRSSVHTDKVARFDDVCRELTAINAARVEAYGAFGDSWFRRGPVTKESRGGTFVNLIPRGSFAGGPVVPKCPQFSQVVR